MGRKRCQPVARILADDLPQVAADQDAPARFGDGVDVVGLERNAGAVAEVVQHRIAGCAEGDVAVDRHAVHGQDHRLAVVDEPDTTHGDAGDKTPAHLHFEVVVVHDIMLFVCGV